MPHASLDLPNSVKENTIAVIPPCGYKPENKQSVIALKMLAWIAQRDNIAIRHARNHGEQMRLLDSEQTDQHQ